MPSASLRPCALPGCHTLVERGRCAQHGRRREIDQHRGSARERGYNARWEKARAMYLKHNPLCAHCEHEQRITPATLVDHIVPHRGDRLLFWDAENWQPLCTACHAVKGAREAGLTPCRHTIQAGAACAQCGQRRPGIPPSAPQRTARGPSRVRVQVFGPPEAAVNEVSEPPHGT